MRLLYFLGFAAGVLSLAACESAAAKKARVEAAAELEAQRSFVNVAKIAAVRDLRDPASAQFRGLAIGRDETTGERVLCGEMNAKNGYGAYAGFGAFYVYQVRSGRVEPNIADAGHTVEQSQRCIAFVKSSGKATPDLAELGYPQINAACGDIGEAAFWSFYSERCAATTPYNGSELERP